jgi:iron complex outermembrane receptor protein
VISNTDIVWELGFNATYNKNEITKLTMTDDPDYIGVEVGGISGGVGNRIQIHTVGYPANSFFVMEQVYDANGNPIEDLYVDRNGDGIVNDGDKYRLEKAAPDVFFGFSSSLIYKDFDLSFSGRANIGNYIYDNNASGMTFSRLYHSSGYLGNVTSNVYDSNFENPKYFSDHFIHNGSFLRIDNISAGYNLSEIVPYVSKLRVFGAIQNVLVVTKYEGMDPEISRGIDNNIYPRPRTFILGVSVEF